MGEKQGVRETMDRMIRESIKNGATPEWAQRKALESARRWDRRQEGLPTGKPPKQD